MAALRSSVTVVLSGETVGANSLAGRCRQCHRRNQSSELFEMSAYITTVRARLREADPTAAMEQHNGIVGRLQPQGEPLGATGHMVFGNAQDPREFLAIDSWNSIEGLQQFMGDPSVQAEIGGMFDGQPEVTVWAARDGWSTF